MAKVSEQEENLLPKTASKREGDKCSEMADIMWMTLVTDAINALATIKRVIDNK